MLRALVALLLLANLAFWAWSQGALEPLGLTAPRERDPARMARQLRPEAVRVLPPVEAQAALRAASQAQATGTATRTSLRCLEAGPFSAATVEAAERALTAAALSGARWVRVRHELAPQYAVVLGPFGNREALQKKSEELGRLQMPAEALDLPGDGAGAPSQPGFSLGRYDSRSAADTALAAFNQRGVRTARVAILKPVDNASRLRVDHATPVLAEQLRALSDAALGAGFGPCATATATR